MKRQIIQCACVALLISSIAHADDFPKRKSGLWSITVSSPVGAGHEIKQCVDQASDAFMEQMYKDMGKLCSKKDLVKTGDGYTIDSDCNLGPTHVVSHGTITGDFNSSYTVQTKSTYDPAMMGMKEGGSTVVAKWMGECQAGQKPGDMILPNGKTMNIQNMRPPAPK